MTKKVGNVKWFNETKGYGFIERENGPDIFVHYNSIISDGCKTLTDGQQVEYEINEDPKGLRAVNVVPTSSEDTTQ